MLIAVVLLVLLVRMDECSGVMNIDLGYEVNENALYWPADGPFSRETIYRGYTENGYW